jgi:hypothetical protein
MAAQRALRLLHAEPLDTDRVMATLELGCGCVVTRAIAADRIQQTVEGATLVAGKFPCPDHAQPS